MNNLSDLRKRFGVLTLLVLLLALVVSVGVAQASHRRGGGRAPEVNVRTGFTDIPDNTGSVTFNEIYVGRSTSKDFVIENLGRGDLIIGDVTVPSGFVVDYISRTTIGRNGIARITVRCPGTTAGTFSGTFSFSNNDADENPYNFTISCTVVPATPPDMAVLLESDLSLIPDDTGSITVTGNQGQGVEIEISVRNTGTSNLTISPPTLPAGFDFFELTGGFTIAPNSYEIYFIDCIGDTAGTFSGMVSFDTNDPDENPYNFNVTCTIN